MDVFLTAGQNLQLDSFGQFEVFGLPGHTLGHLGFFHRELELLFSGDVLFGLGCGRIFEGTAEMKFETLQQFKKLPARTKVYCAHEYTQTNLGFVQQLIAENKMPSDFCLDDFPDYVTDLHQKRDQHKPSVPLSLTDELKFNPFLLSASVEQFAELRRRRNHFA